MTARRLLTPVNITKRARNFRTGKPETWAAESRDGRWTYGREEMTGTPWIVEHRETGEQRWFGTLNAGRAATANGGAPTSRPAPTARRAAATMTNAPPSPKETR